jgi:hypothetical protein
MVGAATADETNDKSVRRGICILQEDAECKNNWTYGIYKNTTRRAALLLITQYKAISKRKRRRKSGYMEFQRSEHTKKELVMMSSGF